MRSETVFGKAGHRCLPLIMIQCVDMCISGPRQSRFCLYCIDRNRLVQLTGRCEQGRHGCRPLPLQAQSRLRCAYASGSAGHA